MSYPLIAGGKVFVIVSLSGANGSVQLVAIDQESGLDEWSVSVGTSFLASHAYDQGLVYVTGTDNLLRAFDASTGALKWSTLVPYNQGVSPIARDGKVYLSSGNARVCRRRQEWRDPLDSVFGLDVGGVAQRIRGPFLVVLSVRRAAAIDGRAALERRPAARLRVRFVLDDRSREWSRLRA